ncbi:MAG: ABC transporter ATP-binding protein [Alphaproteobacteria bacterium]|nr:ABC transporter ATP-binding protein [Alphaproteobacteria bacterium]
MPRTLYGYLWRLTRRHQIVLSVISVVVFLTSMAPLELQRRIVNDVIGDRDARTLGLLCAAYAGVALAMGAIKLGLNVYRGYVGETATLDLRRQVHARMAAPPTAGVQGPECAETTGAEIAMVIAEVEPVGGFVGISISEPLLQGGILVTVFGYMVYLQPWMALTSILLFTPQLVFVPLMQREINRRAARRIRVVREVSGHLVEEARHESNDDGRGRFLRRIAEVFAINMQIFRWKFSMNFLMNGTYHIGVMAILLVGGGLVIEGRTEIGTVVAFISGLAQLNDPWGDLVNYFRESTTAQVKYRLIADAVDRAPDGD